MAEDDKVADTDAVADTDIVTDGLVEGEPVVDTDTLTDALVEGEPLPLAVALTLPDTVPDTVTDGLPDGVIDIVAEESEFRLNLVTSSCSNSQPCALSAAIPDLCWAICCNLSASSSKEAVLSVICCVC